MRAYQFFIPPPLQGDEDELLRFKGLEKDGEGVVFDPLHPLKTVPITSCDIVAGSLQIEPYRPRKWPTSIRLIAGFKREKQDIVVKEFSLSTFTPKSFLATLPTPYMYIGGPNSRLQAQVIHVEHEETHSVYVPIAHLQIKKTTFNIKITLRVIEREVVEQTCLVG